MSRGHNEERLMEAIQLLLEFCCLHQLLCYSDLQTAKGIRNTRANSAQKLFNMKGNRFKLNEKKSIS